MNGVTTYRRLLEYVKPHWRTLALAMIGMLGVALTTAGSAYLVKPVLDDIFVTKNMNMLRILPLIVLVLAVVKALCAWSHTFLMTKVGQEIVAHLRQQVYDRLQSFSLSYFDRTATGTLVSRILNDAGVVQAAVSDAVTGLLRDTCSIIGLIYVVIHQDAELAVISLAIMPFAFIPVIKFGKMLRRASTTSQQSIASVAVILYETLGGGNRIVKAFTMEEYEKARFRKENTKYLSTVLRMVSLRAGSSAVMEFFGAIGMVAMIWYGGYRVINGTSTPGALFSFLAALLLLYDPVKKLNNANNSIQQGIAAAVRLFEVLDTEPEIKDSPGAVELAPVSRGIELRHVHFRYGNEPALMDINLTVSAGQTVAIVGVSGAGKTTLVNLIPRFYEVTEGAVLIDGTDIRGVTLKSLRDQIAVVTQQTLLFNDTIRGNIAYGDTTKTEDEIIAAAKAANAYDFIVRAPEGFDTIVGEQGVRLSGGERQRICIARAILKDAPILILDEATSSLDSESELEVQKAVENLMAGRTTLVIAHRLSTIKNADRIVALADGKIIEEGRHDELLATNSEYRRLYELQFSQVETLPPQIAAGAGR